MTRLVNEPCPSYMRSGVALLYHDPACGGSGLIKTKPFFNDGSLGHEFRRLVYRWTTECSFPMIELFSSPQALATAPSIKTPAFTYFQSATSSLRASATIVDFFWRPPFWDTRALNQAVSAEPGWWRTQSHAT